MRTSVASARRSGTAVPSQSNTNASKRRSHGSRTGGLEACRLDDGEALGNADAGPHRLLPRSIAELQSSFYVRATSVISGMPYGSRGTPHRLTPTAVPSVSMRRRCGDRWVTAPHRTSHHGTSTVKLTPFEATSAPSASTAYVLITTRSCRRGAPSPRSTRSWPSAARRPAGRPTRPVESTVASSGCAGSIQ